MEAILTIALIILGIYVLKTSIGAIFKVGICLVLISMILSLLAQEVIPMLAKVIDLQEYKKKKFKRFINKLKRKFKKFGGK